MLKTLSFSGACTARSELTLSSPRIQRPLKTKRLIITFASGCNDLVEIKIFIALDGQAPTTGEPSGINILQDYGQVGYVIGNNQQFDLDHEVELEAAGSYVKVYANNTDFYDHMINVQVVIEVE